MRRPLPGRTVEAMDMRRRPKPGFTGRTRLLVLLAALPLVAGCLGSGGGKAGGRAPRHATVLHMANVNGEAEPPLLLFAAAVSRESGGSLRIDVGLRYRSGDPLQEKRLIGDVRAGRIQLAWVGARAWDAVGVESFRAIVAPFLVDSYALQEKVLAGPLADQMLAGVRPLGLVGLAVLPGPMRRIAAVRKPLVAPADFTGLKIGTSVSRTAGATLRALGAHPAVLPAEGKLTGTDGLEQQLSSIAGNQYYRVAKYLTSNIVLWPRPLVIFANRKTFDSLSPAQQSALRRAGADVNVLARATAAARSSDREGEQALCAVRMREIAATAAEAASLRRSVTSVYAALERDPRTRSLLGRIESLKHRLAVPADSVPRCPNAGSGRVGSSGVDGVYRMRVSAATVAKHDHVPLSQVTQENYGDFVLVIDRGRFAFTQENENACTWQYGKATLKGSELDWDFTDGGGIAPTNAENKPWDYFQWRWSLYRRVLTLRPIRPTDLTVERWQQTSATPSKGALSQRCPPPKKALP
jgi:TRAP-type C4-dicarboxylate transport system substrate-binding protein